VRVTFWGVSDDECVGYAAATVAEADISKYI
jgi:hypothetical protein